MKNLGGSSNPGKEEGKYQVELPLPSQQIVTKCSKLEIKSMEKWL